MLYFHIPFCKQACHYCDFHFSTSMKYKEEMIHAMMQEIELRKDYLEDKRVESIYFGGGTPSVLNSGDIEKLIDQVARHFEISSKAEITLEANPDDLSSEKVTALRKTAINRFSIGIQSFFEEDLRWMNRAHNAQEADAAIKRVQDAGFENITADLIYGYPLLSDQKWQSNIAQMIAYDIPHISSYAMTVEERTALHHLIKKGTTSPLNDTQSADQMQLLIATLIDHGFEHYEISNFAKKGRYARHNTNYWMGKHYLGIGPSAHSFNGVSRSWNISNNAKYMTGIGTSKPESETEILSFEDRINEYIMTRLRTTWGLELTVIEEKFGNEISQKIADDAQIFLQNNQMTKTNNILTLTHSGKLMADYIASELFITT